MRVWGLGPQGRHWAETLVPPRAEALPSPCFYFLGCKLRTCRSVPRVTEEPSRSCASLG